jgi:hypothetical protein
MLLGGWSVVWGILHFNEPPVATSFLFGGPRYETSLQLERTFGGIAVVLLGYLAYRKGRQD